MSTLTKKIYRAKKISGQNTYQFDLYHPETDSSVVMIGNTDETLSTRLTSLGADRSITLTGDVTGTGTLQTDTDLSISTAVGDDSHNHTGSTVSVSTASRAVVSDSSKNLTVSDTTSTELGYVHGVTSAIQTQLDGKISKADTVTAVSFDDTTKKIRETKNLGTSASTTDMVQFAEGSNVTLTASSGVLTVAAANDKVDVAARGNTKAYLLADSSATAGNHSALVDSGAYIDTDGTLKVSDVSVSSTKTKNYVYAAPYGADGAPGFRALNAADIPDLSSSYSVTSHDHDSDYVKLTSVGAASGVAPLNNNSKIDATYLPDSLDDVRECYVVSGATPLSAGWLTDTDGSSTPFTPVAGVIYIVLSSGAYYNQTYRWATTTYVGVGGSTSVTESPNNGKVQVNGSDVTVYTHPSHTAHSSGMYKVTIDSEGHVSAASDIAASDIKGLNGIGMTGATSGADGASGLVPQPLTTDVGKFLGSSGNWEAETDLSKGSTTGNGNAVTDISVSGHQITLNKGSTFLTSMDHTITVNSGKMSDDTTDISATSSSASSPSVTLGDSGVTAGAYGDNTAQTPTYGATFKVPYLKVNAKGIVTDVSEHNVTIPASDNTDEKVKQTSTTSGTTGYPVLFAYSTSPTSGGSAGSRYHSTLNYKPGTGTLTATAFSGQIDGTLQTTDITAADGDKLVLTDSSDSNKMRRSSISFDGSSSSKVLSKAGSWVDNDIWGTHVQSGTTQPTNQSSGDLWFETIA